MTAVPRPVTLITGASAGIGLELARVFARNGYDLVLVARNEKALNEVAQELKEKHNSTCWVFPIDLAVADAAFSIFQQLQAMAVSVDALVNNAGFGAFGKFDEMPAATILEMVQVNVTSLTALTRLFVPDMIKKRSGKILNVASTAAFQPGPLMAVYYATKAYVLSLSEALANELKGTGVNVTVLCPGPVLTGFQERAGAGKSKLLQRGSMILDAATVAEVGYRGLMKNKTIVIPGLMNRLLAFSVRLGPRSLVTQIARKMQEQKK